MHTCRELTDRLIDYFASGMDQPMDPELRQQIDAQAEMCPHCAALLRTYAATMRLTEEAFREVLPPEDIERLEAAIMHNVRLSGD